MSINKIIPIIMCGGSGSRLWPLSRESFPKQYISIDSAQSESMLQKTQLRINKLNNIVIQFLFAMKNTDLLLQSKLEINIKDFSILLEPIGRNSSSNYCSCFKGIKKNSDPILIVLASDHEIKITKFLLIL